MAFLEEVHCLPLSLYERNNVETLKAHASTEWDAAVENVAKVQANFEQQLAAMAEELVVVSNPFL
jgi:hypothetical protein